MWRRPCGSPGAITDKDLMIKMQEKMGDHLIDDMADRLLEFVKDFDDRQLANDQQNLADLPKHA